MKQGSDSPLSWTAGWANELAESWIAQFEGERRANSLIQVECPFENLAQFAICARKTGYGPQEHREHFLQLVERDPSHPIYSMYLACPGAGGENCRGGEDSTFEGYGFWQTDRLDEINLGADAAQTRALVSGAGDGGCQDFLRLACHQPKMRALAEAISQEIASAGMEDEWRQRVLDALQAAEASALDRQRRYAVCHEMVASLSGTLWRAICQALRVIIRFDPARHELRLVCKPLFLTAQYPLNRFLARLSLLRGKKADCSL